MKHILYTSAIALALAVPQSAKADGLCFGFGFKFRACVKLNFCFEPCAPCCPDPCAGGMAPWYTYFPPQAPYHGHAVAYPHWPQQPMAAAPMQMPAGNAQAYNPYGSYQNVSYYGGGVPSYWYGR